MRDIALLMIRSLFSGEKARIAIFWLLVQGIQISKDFAGDVKIVCVVLVKVLKISVLNLLFQTKNGKLPFDLFPKNIQKISERRTWPSVKQGGALLSNCAWTMKVHPKGTARRGGNRTQSRPYKLLIKFGAEII